MPDDQNVRNPTLRLAAGRESWWAISGQKGARVPEEAIEYRDRTPHLAPELLDQLRTTGFFQRSLARPYATTVLTTTACNLGCAYCFQNLDSNSAHQRAPQRIPRTTLPVGMVPSIVRFIKSQMWRNERDTCTLTLFGGEPLLNPPTCIALLEAMAPIGMTSAEIVTNGVLMLPGTASALARAGLSSAQVTLDGPRAAHDQLRVTRGGRPTYEKILGNLESASRETDLSWNIRVNVSHRNIDSIHELIPDLQSCFRDRSKVTIDLALIDDSGIGYQNEISYSDHTGYRFADVGVAALEAGFRVPLTSDQENCPFCSEVGGRSGTVIDSDGGLYSCWQTAGRSIWKVGDISLGYNTRDVDMKWRSCDQGSASHGTRSQTRRFRDIVDTACLETASLLAHRRADAPRPTSPSVSGE